MLRKLLLSTFVCLLTASVAFAQGTVSGTVTNEATEEPVVGANVFIPSIQRGAATNGDGEYTINNVQAGTYTIRVSFVGFQTKNQQVQVNNNETATADFLLVESNIGLDDVVVTALNIERQSREIGTSISTVSGEEITKARDSNVINSLSGKVSGVNITSQSGTAGGSSRITIRGNSTLTGNTQPLFVIDGVPVSNSNSVGTSSTRLSGGAVDVGNRASDINPDDIESISVLKGASAAALYGQRAQNGVILVTTKSGSESGGTQVTVNSSVRANEPLRLPDFQNEFAQGNQGEFDNGFLNGWGPRIEGQEVPQFPFNQEPSDDNPEGGTIRPLTASPDNVENLFRTGVQTINNISVAGANQVGGDFRLSVTNTQSEGIVPGNKLKRTNISVNAGQEFNEFIQARATANYVFSEGEGRPIQGGNTPNAFTGITFGTPRNLSAEIIQNNVIDQETGEQLTLTDFTNNPFFVTRNNGLNNEVQRFFGTGEAILSPTDWINITGRVGIDFFTDNRERPTAVGTLGRLDGRLGIDRFQEREIDANLLVGFDRQLSEAFSFDATVGGNLNSRSFERFSNQGTDFIVEGLNNFGNFVQNVPSNFTSQQRIVGLFFDATLGFENYLFLNLTGRNDWSSTLPVENRSFFYPSASLSFVFTDAFDIGGDFLSFGKLRASAAEVGSDEQPFQLAFSFFPDQVAFGQFGTDLVFPINGARAFDATNTVPPVNLRPQRQRSYEIGTELQFFDGRLGLDVTYYNIRTRDQIVSVPVPLSTGFGANRRNSGTLENEGLEALLDITPVQSNDFQWTTSINFARNDNTVIELAEGLQEFTVPPTGFNGLRVQAVVGEELALFGTGFLRNDQGEVILDPDTGLRQTGGETRLGPTDPDYTVGINNTFNYKGVNLSFLLDIKQGGTVVSGTVQDLFASGLAQETGDLRNEFPDGGFTPEGVVPVLDDDGEATGEFTENTTTLNGYGSSIQDYYENLYQGGIFEEATYDGDFVKLREVKLGYTLPASWLQSLPLTSATVSFEGRNLWIISSDAPDIDPETNVFGSGAIPQGIEFNNIPSARTFGGNIQLRF